MVRLVGISVKVEKRKIECLILKKITTDVPIFITKGGSSVNTLNESTEHKCLRNRPFSNLIGQINYTPGIPWAYDETGISDTLNVDMDFGRISFSDIPALQLELKRYGLELVKEFREREMFIVMENGYTENIGSEIQK